MENNLLFKTPRNSKMLFNEVYFWTDTIKDWKHLLKQDKYKEYIIKSLKALSDKKLFTIYGFVIMPNHLCSRSQIPVKPNNETQSLRLWRVANDVY